MQKVQIFVQPSQGHSTSRLFRSVKFLFLFFYIYFFLLYVDTAPRGVPSLMGLIGANAKGKKLN